MTDLEKLVAKTRSAICVEEVTTKLTYYNCFGDNIEEKTKTISEVFIFDDIKGEWVKGTKGADND